MRSEVRPEDRAAVRALVEATGFFNAAEVDIAESLVREDLERGGSSGYFFLFAEDEKGLTGYTCFGHTPATESSYDLYWIAVHPRAQSQGVGRRLMQASESAIAARGGTQVWVETAGRPQYAPTRAFYRSCGYAVAATLDDFYAPGDAKVIFVRRLSSTPAPSSGPAPAAPP